MPDLSNRKQHEAAIAAMVLMAFDDFQRERSWESLQRNLEQGFRDTLPDVYLDAAGNVDGVDLEGTNVEQSAAEYAREMSTTLALQIVATSQAYQRQARDEGMIFGAERAGGIGITETTRAISAGEATALLILAAQTGTVFRPIWRKVPGECPSGICIELNGKGEEVYSQIVPGGPPAHPHCNCYLDYEEAA